MSYCEKCSHRFTGEKGPRCSGSPVLTRSQANDAVKHYVWVMFAGLLGTLLATYRYPLVDLGIRPLVICLVVFFYARWHPHRARFAKVPVRALRAAAERL